MNTIQWIKKVLLTAAVILFSACSSQPVTIQRNAPAGQAPNAQTAPFLDFWADQTTIQMGACTTLHWRSNWGGVWIEEKKYPENSSMQVCPASSRQYSAEIGDQVITRNIFIQVQSGAAQAAQPPATPPADNSSPRLDFWADNTIINKGECTTLHWSSNWGGVWMGEQKHPQNGEMKVCPTGDMRYDAEIGDQVLTRSVQIQVRSNAAQQPAPQQPAPQQPAPQQPQPEPKITNVNLVLESDKVVAKVTTNGFVKIGWIWRFLKLNDPNYKTDACFGMLDFSSAGTKSATCSIGGSGCDNCAMDFYARSYKGASQGTLISYGRVNLPQLLTTDLAVTDLFADNMPRGRIYARLTNRGPNAIINSKVTLDCEAVLKPKSGSSGWDDFIIKQTFPMVTLAHNETKTFYTGIDNQSELYSYLVTCIATPSDGSYLSIVGNKQVIAKENNPGNNTYKEDIPFFFQ